MAEHTTLVHVRAGDALAVTPTWHSQHGFADLTFAVNGDSLTRLYDDNPRRLINRTRAALDDLEAALEEPS